MTDWRVPENRREGFLRYYGFKLRHRAHAGMVYLTLPRIASTEKMGPERRFEFAVLETFTHNTASTVQALAAFPRLFEADPEAVLRWFVDNAKIAPVDGDQRFFRRHIADCLRSILAASRGEHPASMLRGLRAGEAEQNFREVWRVSGAFHGFGRLNKFNFAENLAILGAPIDCDSLFLEDLSGAASHRNGLVYVMGEEARLLWDKQSPRPLSARDLERMTNFAEGLLAEARGRFGPNATRYNLESALCGYKLAWSGQRYPAYYMDQALSRMSCARQRGADVSALEAALVVEAPEVRARLHGAVDPTAQRAFLDRGELLMVDL